MNFMVFYLDSSHLRITQVQIICLKILSGFFQYKQITLRPSVYLYIKFEKARKMFFGQFLRQSIPCQVSNFEAKCIFTSQF